jgi:hypothetical protein
MWLRAAEKLDYRDPGSFLVRLRQLEQVVAPSETPTKIKNLRTNELKPWREARDAALFCYGMSQRLGLPICFAKGESQDYDFVASWVADDVRHFAPVQLKEVVPTGLNTAASLAAVIEGLRIYGDSQELTVAVRFNQREYFEPSAIAVPRLNIAALWVFAAIERDQSEWGLWGNFLEQPEGTRFAYPT